MWNTPLESLVRIIDAGVNVLGLEAIAILVGFGGVIGIVLGITAVKKARTIGND